MVIPEYQDGKTDEAFLLFKSYDDELTGENAKSRQAGGQVPQASKETPKVIVDSHRGELCDQKIPQDPTGAAGLHLASAQFTDQVNSGGPQDSA